jgi:hypothetical protein
MTPNTLSIRDEQSTDYQAISDVTFAAFEKMEISNHTEQFVIEALRSANALTVSLVAEVDGRVVGHIAFSPVVCRPLVQKAAAWSGTRDTTDNLDFEMSADWGWTGFPRKCSSFSPWTATSRKVRSCFTKDLVPTGNKTQQRTADCYR